jgi:hypothetical protein
VWIEAANPVYPDSVMSFLAANDGDVDLVVVVAQDREQIRGCEMAENRALPAGKYGSALAGEGHTQGVADEIYAAMNPVETPVRHTVRDRTAVYAGGDKLGPGYAAVLASCDLRDQTVTITCITSHTPLPSGT